MIQLIEDTRKSLGCSLPRFIYIAYFYAEKKVTIADIFELIDLYEEENLVNDVVLDYAYAVMCGLATPIKPKGKCHGKRKTS